MDIDNLGYSNNSFTYGNNSYNISYYTTDNKEEKEEEKKEKLSKEELEKIKKESWPSDNPFASIFAKEYDPADDIYDTLPLTRMSFDEENKVTFTLESTDPMNSGRRLYTKKSMTFRANRITPLVGCNGIGKTTLLTIIKDILEDNHYFVYTYDNMHDGERNAKSEAVENFNKPDWERYSQLMSSSEGENIQFLSLEYMHKIEPVIRGEIIRDSSMHKFRDADHIFLLLDAVDSGSSIDNIININYHLKSLIELAYEYNKYLYIIVAANSYELARNQICWDVARSKDVVFSDYEQYRKFIIETRRRILKQWRSNKKEEE